MGEAVTWAGVTSDPGLFLIQIEYNFSASSWSNAKTIHSFLIQEVRRLQLDRIQFQCILMVESKTYSFVFSFRKLDERNVDEAVLVCQ